MTCIGKQGDDDSDDFFSVHV